MPEICSSNERIFAQTYCISERMIPCASVTAHPVLLLRELSPCLQAPSQFDDVLITACHMHYLIVEIVLAPLRVVNDFCRGRTERPTSYVPSGDIRYADDMKNECWQKARRSQPSGFDSQLPTDASRIGADLHPSFILHFPSPSLLVDPHQHAPQSPNPH